MVTRTLASSRENMLNGVRKRALTRTMSCFRPSFDPHIYTHGRWLDRDSERQALRVLRFNFDALLQIAVDCSPGAKSVVGCEKKEGGFNRVFSISLDNGKKVLARIPTRAVGPTRLTINSEVATLRLIRAKCQIPVPVVLAWSSVVHNAVGIEYLIMEEMPGVPLSLIWNDMKASQHVACIGAIGETLKQLWNLDFPGYGSIYLNTDRPEHSIPLDNHFNIGPICRHQGRDQVGLTTSAHLQGPWRNVDVYFSDLINNAKLHPARGNSKWTKLLEAHASVVRIAERTLRCLTEFEPVRKASEPLLSHPDLHTRNILVDPENPTKITGLIDWQFAAIQPAFVVASDVPDFARTVPAARGSEEEKGSEDPSKPLAKLRADAQFCSQTWAIVANYCQKYCDATTLDPAVLNFLAAPSTGWANDPFALRILLTDLAGSWSEVGLSGASFYQPAEVEALDLQNEMDEQLARRELVEHLMQILGCGNDGWVPLERWEEVLALYQQEYERLVASLVDESQDEVEVAVAIAKANRMWPFDQR